MTTHIGTALSTNDHPLVPMRPLPPSATSTSPGYREPITLGGFIHEYRMVA
jgi:hypothetical protein